MRDQLAGKIEGAWSLESGDPGSLRFQYPTKPIGTIGYIKADVLIEFGHADSWPATDVTISPYIVEALEPVTGSIAIADDYAQMSAMIFGTIPTFDELTGGLADLEARVNGWG